MSYHMETEPKHAVDARTRGGRGLTSRGYIDPRDGNPDFEFPRFRLDEVPHPNRDGTPGEFVVPVLCDGIIERKFSLDDVPHPKRE